jgi:hemerythrin-like domain-containing protein
MDLSMKILYDEHEIIINAIDAAKHARTLIEKDSMQYERTVRELIVFFRNYADKFHHFKEEEILFPEMNKKNELLADGIIKEMFDNHDEFRSMIKKIEKFLDEKNYVQAQKQMEAYGEELMNHIAVENDEVFQMAESLFDVAELEKILGRFQDCDRELGNPRKEELVEMARSIRKNLLFAE